MGKVTSLPLQVWAVLFHKPDQRPVPPYVRGEWTESHRALGHAQGHLAWPELLPESPLTISPPLEEVLRVR